MKFKFDKGLALSLLSMGLGLASVLAKSKDSEYKEQVKKEEWIQEAMERLSKKNES